MRFRTLPLLAAAAAIVATPAMAAPNAAASLSVAKSARVGASSADGSKLVTGGAVYALAGFLAFVAAVVIVREVSNDDDSDSN